MNIPLYTKSDLNDGNRCTFISNLTVFSSGIMASLTALPSSVFASQEFLIFPISLRQSSGV